MKHEGREWVWCSDCIKKANPKRICRNCYLRYEEHETRKK